MAFRHQSRARILQLLRRLVGKEIIATLYREAIDPQGLTGYLVGLSSDFVLIHCRSNDITLDGYAAVRIQDITLVEDKPKYADFYTEALKLRGYKPECVVGICLDNTAAIIEWVNKHYPLVTIHREAIRNDECSIGRIEKLTDKTVILQWITPGARWDGYSPRYRLTNITKIDFGGLYEDALARVARIQPDESGFYGDGLNSNPASPESAG